MIIKIKERSAIMIINKRSMIIKERSTVIITRIEEKGGESAKRRTT
jgi:hypothetical protein